MEVLEQRPRCSRKYLDLEVSDVGSSTRDDKTVQLVEEISFLEDEISVLEQHLLTLYKKVFDECLHACQYSQRLEVIQPICLERDASQKQQGHFGVLFPQYDSGQHCGSPVPPSTRKSNINYIEMSSQCSPQNKNSPLSCKSKTLEHGSNLKEEYKSRVVPHTLKDYFYKSPNKLSEELVHCVTGIYIKLSESSLIEPSPTSSYTSACTLHDQANDGRSSGCMTPYLSNTPLRDLYRLENSMDSSDSYSSMVEITSISLDKERVTHAGHLLRTFRSMVEHLENVDPTALEHDAKLAFWINIYNCLVMHAFLAYGIPENNLQKISLFKRMSYKIGNHSINAIAIEQSILSCKIPHGSQWLQRLLSSRIMLKKGEERRHLFKQAYGLGHPEPLVCFSLCGGGISDPVVRVYTKDNIYNELDAAKKEFLQANIFVQDGSKIFLPKLVELYSKEAGIGSANLLDWLCQNVSEMKIDAIRTCIAKKSNRTLTSYLECVPYNGRFRYLFSRDLLTTVA